MGDDTAGNERLDAAFAGWIEAQQAALETMRNAPDVPRTDVDVAEGYRWVTRLASLAQDWFLEKSDPLHPQLFQLQNEYRKLLVDNPDVRYLFAVLDEHHSYRLTGTRGEAAYVGLTFGTPIGKGAVGGRTGTTTQVHLDEFELGPGGEVDILIAPADQLPDPRPVNSIVLEPGTGQVAFRETFFDKRHDRPSDLRIELVGEVPPLILDADDLATKLEFAGLFVQFVAATAVNMWADTAHNVNSFGGTAGAVHVEAQDDEVRSHSDADMTYHGGRWVLGEDEALVDHRARARPCVPVLGPDHHQPVDGELRLPLHHNEPQQPLGGAVGGRVVAAGRVPDRPGRAELARHRAAPRGVHDRALGAGRRSAPSNLRARADG